MESPGFFPWIFQPLEVLENQYLLTGKSHASWKVLDFSLDFLGPGKSSKISLVVESPEN